MNRSPSPPLSATGLRKAYGDRLAVDDVSLTLEAGCVHGLLGPNGAGKSSVLRMLLGLVSPDGGTIATPAGPLGHDLPRGLCGVAGFVDTPHFYPYLTASRNLELLSAWDGTRGHARVEELLELVGLADRAQSRVRGFSTGMRQRLGVAAALLSEPAVLVVDEPTSGLDPAAVRDLHALLLALADSGRAILLSSHDLDEVEHLCRDVTVLRGGRVVYSGGIDALAARTGRRVWSLDTTDNDRAALGADPAVTVEAAPSGGLRVSAEQHELDLWLIRLAAAGVTVRELRRDELAFEALYFQLTGTDAEPAPSVART